MKLCGRGGTGAVGLMVTYIAKTRATSEENTPLIN